ncbi:MAG: AtpZ/AtpI family protein [Planctomycetota bacterium]|nr:AtpZ/AtpI family protein [Planctomycetota bacterium]
MNLGAVFAVTVGLFVLLGWWLDGKYGWAPWGTVGCGLLGVTAAMYHFLKETL